MNQHEPTHPAFDPNHRVAALTSSVVRSFLYEISEGARSYRSLHSLTQQVEHQYHGRFAVELIQNAHDVMRPGDSGRILFHISEDGPHGTLYVANDGTPFTDKNFEGISRLGQSTKNPEESIGNKGIGFRSALELTREPAIFSRLSTSSPTFDGYCFEFSISVQATVRDAALQLLARDDASSPFLPGALAEGWGEETLRRFRTSALANAASTRVSPEEWLSGEIALLSPYLMPLPAPPVEDAVLTELEADGYATVVRLQLKDAVAARTASDILSRLSGESLLFLSNAKSLEIRTPSGSRTYRREETTSPSRIGGATRVKLSGASSAEDFRMWSRRICLDDAPVDVRDALARLPGSWPELKSAPLSVAVREADHFRPGTLSIFLPTHLPSGSGAHVSSAFFGDMSRTSIDFGNPETGATSAEGTLNRYLLTQCADLAVAAIARELAGKGEAEARMIVDILSPSSEGGTSAIWSGMVCESAARSGREIADRIWSLTAKGWRTPRQTKLIPVMGSEACVVSETAFRRLSAFPAYHPCLDSRREQIAAIHNICEIDYSPPEEGIAKTVERIAAELATNRDADWNGFWAETTSLPFNLAHLRGKKVLLGSDNRLHRANEPGFTMFFAPRQGEEDASDSIRNIPASLQPYVSFLSDRIAVHAEVGGRLLQNALHAAFLKARLVHELRRETILQDVALANLPQLPAPHDTPSADLSLQLQAIHGERGLLHPASRSSYRDRFSDFQTSSSGEDKTGTNFSQL